LRADVCLSFSTCRVINYLQEKDILPNLQDLEVIEHLTLEHVYLWRGKRDKNGSRGRLMHAVDEPGYDVTWWNPALYLSAVKDIYNSKRGLLWKATENQKRYGVPSVDPSSKDEQYLELGKHIRGFFAYMESFPRRTMGISVSEGGQLSLEPSREDKWKPYSKHARDVFTFPNIPPAPPHAAPAERYNYLNSVQCGFLYTGGSTIEDLLLIEIRCFDNMLFPGKFGGAQAQWVIQDPFILDRNTAQNVSKGVARTWDLAVAMAVAWLNDGEREGTLPNLADMLLPSEVLFKRPKDPEAVLAQKVLQKWKPYRQAVEARGGQDMPALYGGWYLQ